MLHRLAMTTRHASCACGRLTLTCVGEPARVSMCHCQDCQRRTGSAFSIAAFFPRAAVSAGPGEGRTFTRDSAAGSPVTFHFCAGCGASVYWEPARLPHLIGVAAGAFADPDFPPPEQSVWTKDKHAWVALPADIPAFEAAPVR